MAGSEPAQTLQNSLHDPSDDSSPASSSKDEVAVQVERDEEDEANEQDPDQPPLEPSSPSSAPHQPVSLLDLPTELLEKIVALADDSRAVDRYPRLCPRRNLTRYARVCKAFLPIARNLLYSSIEYPFLGLGEVYIQQRAFNRLLFTLARNPHLAALVGEVECSVNIADDASEIELKWNVLVDEDADGWDDDWLEKFSKKHGVDMELRLRRFFALLPHIKELRLWSHADFYDFRPLISSFRFPALTTLDAPYFTLDVLPTFPNITNLACQLSATPAAQSSPEPPALERCDVSQNPRRFDPSQLEWVASASHSSLRHLAIPYTDTVPRSDFLLQFSNRTHLTLQNYDGYSAPKVPPTRPLPTLPSSIHTLTLGNLCEGRTMSPVPDLDRLDQTLFAGFSSASIRTLVLIKTPYAASVYTELLSNPNHLPNLELFDMHTVFFYPSMEETPGWKTAASDLAKVPDPATRDLKDRLGKVLRLLQSETSPGGLSRDKEVVRVAKEAIKQILESEGDVWHVEAERAELERHKAAAAKRYFDAVAPLMRDSLLRYLANDKYRDALVNHSITPGKHDAVFHHYPTPQDVVNAVHEERLSPAIGADLLAALQLKTEEGKTPTYRGVVERNNAAHPTASNRRFLQYAELMDEHQKGWLQAYKEFVDTEKAREEDRLAKEHYNDLGHEAEPWDPSCSGPLDPKQPSADRRSLRQSGRWTVQRRRKEREREKDDTVTPDVRDLAGNRQKKGKGALDGQYASAEDVDKKRREWAGWAR
ncbi:hypothetical protein JCM8097_005553 [Rhodosporidiobolus ruineniae]